jgi:D-3-phosphoglycerate dehydrogenase / 2-oxoglutarate reductase
MSASSSRLSILVTSADLAPEAEALLSSFELVYAGKQPDEERLVSLCREKEPIALIVRYGRITPRIIDASPRMRVIAKHGTGIDTIDVEHAQKRGITVNATTGVNAAAVAEHAWGLILACSKSIPQLNERMHAGEWDKATHKSLELSGLTLGVVGVGAIGRRVAAIGVALGMRVIAYDPYATHCPEGVTMDSLHSILGAHVVTLHCPLTTENRHLVNRDTLPLFREGAILVNTARGGLVDEAALVAALHSGKFRAAALDTFEREPPPADHYLRGVRGLIMTPHVGGVSSAAYTNMGLAAARNVLSALG